MRKVAFLGLGVMGGNMARHLAMKAAEATVSDVVVFNRTPDVAKKWLSTMSSESSKAPTNLTVADDITMAVKNADVVLACLGNDASVRAVADVAFPAMQPGAIFIDHTTASASLARILYQTAKQGGLHFLDAPISGGQAGAEKGILSIMVGGDQDIFDKAQPVMGCYGKVIELIGGAGAGQLTKMVNQVAIAGLLQGLSEAIFLGEQAGIDMEKALKVITGGAAQSWQMNNRGTTMLQRKFDFGFQVKWMVKDLLICLDEAKNLGVDLPVTKQIEKFYEELTTKGREKLDTSSLITLLNKK